MYKLVVGLGNPGAKYDGTRHNVGFDVLNYLAKKLGAPAPRSKHEGQLSTVDIGSTKLMLLWPLTFMNLSGRCVKPIVNFYKIDIHSNLLVTCDDLSLPLGKLRIRTKGSAGGQKGLADILQSLGSQEIPRLRIGIDPTPPQWETADYVLSRFRKEEKEMVDIAVATAADAIVDWCDHDIAHSMNRFN